MVSTSASYTFTLNANRTLAANFTQIQYTIRLSPSPNDGGTVSGDGTFPEGSSRTATASAKSGYTFVNWTEGGTVVSTSASYTFSLNGNRRLVANFTGAPLMPADLNADLRIVIDEVTGYGSAWKKGDSWANPPNPIPIDYLTRAGYLWKNGECYKYDSSQALPLAWVIGDCSGGHLTTLEAKLTTAYAAPGLQSAIERTIAAGTVTLSAAPSAASSVYAIEETLPAGLTPANITENGSWDSTNHKIKWGPFFDNTPRSLSYQVSGIAGSYVITGVGSFDGQSVVTSGSVNIDLETGLKITSLSSAHSGKTFSKTFPTQSSRNYYIEVTEDLASPAWNVLAGPLPGTGQMVTWPDSGSAGLQGASQSRFFRVRSTAR